MIRIALLAILIAIFDSISVAAVEGAGNDEVIKLEPFVVTAKGEVYLQMSFRGHIVFAGLKDLTFKILPASWKKAGIEIGDRVVSIDGQPIHGMGLIDFLKSGQKRTKPMYDKPPQEVHTVFEIQSKATNRIWKFGFIQKAGDCIIYGTPDHP